MEVLIQASQLLLSLSILVILHELGHFVPAKLFKTRVEKFYLFFDPWFSLVKTKKGETEYGIGWLPLGGYVKISGMIDESMDKEQMKQPPQPWEFRSKPAWQRLIIMLGGVIVNVILGVLIYMMVLFVWGEEYIPTENMKYGVYVDDTAREIGFENGDKIISVGGEKVEKFQDVQLKILVEEKNTVEVERNEEVKKVTISDQSISKLLDNQRPFMQVAVIPEVDEVVEGSNAEKAGLQKGDILQSIDGKKTPFFQDVVARLDELKGKTVDVSVLRNNQTVSLEAEVTEDGKLGFGIVPLNKQLVFKRQKYTLVESIPGGFSKAYGKFDSYVKQMKLIFKPETGAYKSLGGFITMAKAFPSEWNWEHFWNFTAFLSLILAVMNILPIPALDGGHVMFLIYEIITGRKPNDKFMEYAQIAGIVILLALMILANGNDIRRLFD